MRSSNANDYFLKTNTYWGQFDGLLERLQGYQRQIAEKMSGMGAEVVDAGMVDDPAKADAAARRFAETMR